MSAVILNKNIFWNSDFLSPISVSFTFFPLYFILLALSWFMCILFVLLLMNKSWHLAVLSFSRPPSFLPLHLEYFSSTTCPPPLTLPPFFGTLTLSNPFCTAVFSRLWPGSALRSGHTVPFCDATSQSWWNQHKLDMQNQWLRRQWHRSKGIYLSFLLSASDFDSTT